MLLTQYIAKHTGKEVRANQVSSGPAGPYVFVQRQRDTISGLGIADHEHYDHVTTFRITAFRDGAFEAILNLRAAIMRDNVEVRTFAAQVPLISDIADVSNYDPSTAYEERAMIDLSLKYRNRITEEAPSIEQVQIRIGTENTDTDIDIEA